jgi:hypothetical protein
MKDKLTIICDGDSWVFGSEIVDPNILKNKPVNTHPGEYDWLEENNDYRLSKIFSTQLGNLLNADVVNLSWPADDNNTILNRIISYISTNYISKGLSTDNLFLIVGWSSPERNSFWYKDENHSQKLTIWPSIPNLQIENQKIFWDYYVEYLWNKEEYLPRHIMNILQFQNFCKVNNIDWMCFNSFYQNVGKSPNEWFDIDVLNELSNLKLNNYPYHLSNNSNRQYYNQQYLSLWNMIDSIRFYKKNEINNTFKSYMELNNTSDVYNGWHPSPSSHKIWAEELYNYIKENKIINE